MLLSLRPRLLAVLLSLRTKPSSSRSAQFSLSSCAAFLDYTSENPTATLPEVSQLMWVHIEEPDPESDVVDKNGERLWYRVPLRDVSGSVLMGIPQRCALVLANCSSMDEFTKKHAAGALNMPLLCQARVSRVLRGKDGASQPVTFVDHLSLIHI